jgi:hypothetical protein
MDMWMVKQEINGFPNLDTIMKGGSCSRTTIIATNTNTKTHFFPNFPPPFMVSTSLFLHKLEEDNICLMM